MESQNSLHLYRFSPWVCFLLGWGKWRTRAGLWRSRWTFITLPDSWIFYFRIQSEPIRKGFEWTWSSGVPGPQIFLALWYNWVETGAPSIATPIWEPPLFLTIPCDCLAPRHLGILWSSFIPWAHWSLIWAFGYHRFCLSVQQVFSESWRSWTSIVRIDLGYLFF